MRGRFILFIAALFFTAQPVLAQPKDSAAQDSSAFLATIDSVPLMAGLQELEDEALVFDKPSGRIAETMAAGEGVTKDEIEQFYSKTLPQLGWVRIGPHSYQREDEVLSLDISEQKQFGLIRFSVKPQ